MSNVNARESRFNECAFSANIARTDFANSTVRQSKFISCELNRVSFEKALLAGSDFLTANIDSETKFTDAKMLGAKMRRHSIDGLPEGTLTPAQLSIMDIRDDSATLRASYTGFMNLLHLAALAAFLLPYAVYLWTISLRASPRCDLGPCEYVISRFWHFIYSGGNMDRQIAVWSMAAFAFALVYNALRAVLLWKANKLELQRQATGFSPRFSLDGGWGTAYRWSYWMFWINIAALFVHSLHFLMRHLSM